MCTAVFACSAGRTQWEMICILVAFLNATDRRVLPFQAELWEMAARLFETVALPIKVAHQRLMEVLLA